MQFSEIKFYKHIHLYLEGLRQPVISQGFQRVFNEFKVYFSSSIIVFTGESKLELSQIE